MGETNIIVTLTGIFKGEQQAKTAKKALKKVLKEASNSWSITWDTKEW